MVRPLTVPATYPLKATPLSATPSGAGRGYFISCRLPALPVHPTLASSRTLLTVMLVLAASSPTVNSRKWPGSTDMWAS